MNPHDLAAAPPPHPRPSTPSSSPEPSPPAPAPAPLSLDEQIEQLERRLIAREAWLRSTAKSLGQRAQRSVTERSWVWPVLGGGAVLWLGWRWWHRRHHRTPARPVAAALPVHVAVPRRDRLAALPWASLVALGWPLLPMTWRSRSSPATATAVVSTGLSILWWLVSRRGR